MNKGIKIKKSNLKKRYIKSLATTAKQNCGSLTLAN